MTGTTNSRLYCQKNMNKMVQIKSTEVGKGYKNAQDIGRVKNPLFKEKPTILAKMVG